MGVMTVGGAIDKKPMVAVAEIEPDGRYASYTLATDCIHEPSGEIS